MKPVMNVSTDPREDDARWESHTSVRLRKTVRVAVRLVDREALRALHTLQLDEPAERHTRRARREAEHDGAHDEEHDAHRRSDLQVPQRTIPHLQRIAKPDTRRNPS